MEQIMVLIVIPCVSLNEYVMDCLRGCLGLDYDPYQIVLLPDAPVELPEEFRDRNILVAPTGDVTIAAKRNAAMRLMPGARYYAFIDSDACPADRDWLKHGVASFTRDDIQAIGGPSLSPPGEPLYQKVVGNATQSVFVSGNLAFSKRRSANRFCNSLHSCNLIVSGRSVRELGGFLEKLKTGEDRELCGRIRKQGGRILFNNKVMVYHHNRPLGAPFFSQRFVHGYSIYAIMATDRGLHSLILVAPLAASVVFVLGFGWSAAQGLALMPWAAPVALYGVAAMSASMKYSDSLKEVPLTFMAIILSNAGYVLGSIIGLFQIKINFKKLYDNYRGSRKRIEKR